MPLQSRFIRCPVNSFLSLSCRHLEISSYGHKRSLIVLGTFQYFLNPRLRQVEIGRYGQERFRAEQGTSQLLTSYMLVLIEIA